MSMILTILAFIIICAVDLPALLKNKQRREIVVFFAFFIPGIILSIMLSLDIPIPNPNNGIAYLVQPLKQIFLYLFNLFS